MNRTGEMFPRALAILVSSLLFAAGVHAVELRPQHQAKGAPFARAGQGRALFEQKCKTVAGEKIYRTVKDVEGLLLLKVRPMASDRDWQDPMWPGAAFAHEAGGGEPGYISTFLKYEAYVGDMKGKRSANKIGLTTDPTDLPGYRYVEVIDEKDGKRYRYTGSVRDTEVKSSVLIGGDGKMHVVKNWVLDKKPSAAFAPRYGVTYEEHVVPEERVMGIASGTVKVLDLETKEVLGEMTRYVWSPGGPTAANPVPWLSARKCGGHSDFQATRFFVDQVLLPKKDN